MQTIRSRFPADTMARLPGLFRNPADRAGIAAPATTASLAMKPDLLKQAARYAVQQVAARAGPQARRHRLPQLLILMYHRILPKLDQRARFEEPGMQVTPESFSLHLDILKKRFDMVRLSEWLETRNQGARLPPMACAITFDDGWADNYEFAYPVLQKHSVPATIFLVSGMIGTGKRFWPERLARLVVMFTRDHDRYRSHPTLAWIRELCVTDVVPGTTPTPDELSAVIARAKTLTDGEINDRLDEIEGKLGPDDGDRGPALLSWEQLSEMIASGHVEPGSHTRQHTRLNAQLPAHILEAEIAGSRQAIEQRTGKPVTTFCFPNGDYTPRALELVRNHYTGAVTTARGWNNSAADAHLLHRIGIHEGIAGSRTAFLARISGWL